MKKISTLMLALSLYLTAIFSQTPAITFTTSNAVGTSISFYMAANTSTTLQVDFGDGTKVNRTITGAITQFSGTLVGSQTVKIYGTPIVSFEIDDVPLTSLDVSNDVALTQLWCIRDQLNTLDVTKNTALTLLSCYSNKLTTLDVTKNTSLTTLDCDGNLLTSLDVTKNTALIVINCGINNLSTLDISKNTALIQFACSINQITSLDVTNNINLTLISCASNQLTTLDVSRNTALTILFCYYNSNMTTLDVSKNTALTTLGCQYNHLSVLDITKNTALTELTCWGNLLSFLDVSKNTALTTLSCRSNQLTFTSLPLKQSTWTTYTYAPQGPIAISKAVGTGNAIDLSSQLSINGNTTLYKWKTMYGVSLTEGTDYTVTNGKTVFLKTQTDSVYCEMTNASFPDFASYPLKSTNTKVTVTYSVSFNTQGGSTVSDITGYYNTTITAPNPPTFTGHTFAGWYKEAGCTNAWNFATDKITANITLYAKWQANSFSVNFNTQGGSAVSDITGYYNTTITAPNPPTFTGYTFAGWYKETGCTNAWNFAIDKVVANTILYAKWTTGTSAVEEIKTDVPEIYSNKETLHINLTYNAQCSIFDMNGRLVISRFIYSGANTLQLRNSGIYLLKVTGTKSSITKKVLVE